MNNLEYLRKVVNIDAEFIAKLLNIQKRRYLMMERGTGVIPEWAAIMLARIYGVSIHAVFKGYKFSQKECESLIKVAELPEDKKKSELYYNLTGKHEKRIKNDIIQDLKSSLIYGH